MTWYHTMAQGRLYTPVAALHSDHYSQVQCTQWGRTGSFQCCWCNGKIMSIRTVHAHCRINDNLISGPFSPVGLRQLLSRLIRPQCILCMSFIQVTSWLFSVLALTCIVLYDCSCHPAYTSRLPSLPLLHEGGAGSRLPAQHKSLPRFGSPVVTS